MAEAFGAYMGLLFRAAKFPNLTTVKEQNFKRACVLFLVTCLLCLPAAILFFHVRNSPGSFTVVQAMFLGRFLPILYFSFVLVGFSEYVAIKLKCFEMKLTMYRRMPEDADDEEK